MNGADYISLYYDWSHSQTSHTYTLHSIPTPLLTCTCMLIHRNLIPHAHQHYDQPRLSYIHITPNDSVTKLPPSDLIHKVYSTTMAPH